MITATIVSAATLLIIWVISGYLPTRNIAMPTYEVIEKKPEYEIRRYSSYIVAETRQLGSQSESLSRGFNELFRYISGDNIARSKISMTAPVLKNTEANGQKIPMTAPVISEGEKDSSIIAFVMPPGFTLENLPQPNSKNVTLRVVPPRMVAAITFSGYATEERTRKNAEKLLSALKRDGRYVTAATQIALYNPPWTPPFMRRNEVLVEISQGD
jgi:DNA gyrase inhibitor GyrI